jgi:hypothetical protein
MSLKFHKRHFIAYLTCFMTAELCVIVITWSSWEFQLYQFKVWKKVLAELSACVYHNRKFFFLYRLPLRMRSVIFRLRSFKPCSFLILFVLRINMLNTRHLTSDHLRHHNISRKVTVFIFHLLEKLPTTNCWMLFKNHHIRSPRSPLKGANTTK